MTTWKPRIETIAGKDSEPDKVAGRVVKALLREDRVEEAEREVRAMLDGDPGNWVAHMLWADVMHRTGHLDAALASAREAVRLAPMESRPLVRLGRLQAEAGSTEKARATLERAVDLAPESVQALLGLARVLERDGSLDRTTGLVETAVRAQPEHLPARMALARLYARTGRADEAVRQLDAALGVDPDHKRARDLRTRLMARMERATESELEVEPASPINLVAEVDPDSDPETDTDTGTGTGTGTEGGFEVGPGPGPGMAVASGAEGLPREVRRIERLLRKGAITEARQAFDALGEAQRNSVYGLMLRGDFALSDRRFDAATELYAGVLRCLPDGPETMERLRGQDGTGKPGRLARGMARAAREGLRQRPRDTDSAWGEGG